MLDVIADRIAASPGMGGKRDIGPIVARVTGRAARDIAVGDDCAAIRDGDGWLLFAIEGFVNAFVAAEPWFAGYCGVLVNLSDIAAMGGRPVAVVDALWARDDARAAPIAAGLGEASARYGVPIVGGHSNAHSEREQLSVAILGRARRLITSFDATPGDALIAAVDLRGGYRPVGHNWDASTQAPPDRLRADLELLPALAEDGLCAAGKDISMGGVLGTLLMLLECSGVGAVIDVASVPRPPEAAPARWLCDSFPSFGFVLAVAPAHVDAVCARFAARDIACAPIGACDETQRLTLRDAGRSRVVWDLARDAYIGGGRARAHPASSNTGSGNRSHA